MIPRAAITALAVLLSASPTLAQESGFEKLIDFESGDDRPWFVVNDGVMGGRSSSTLRPGDPGVAVFEGYLSLENNGGFASVRVEVPGRALAGASRVALRVRGDGNRYELRLRPGGRMDGVAFRSGFETVEGEWVVVELPIASFEPTFRGYRPRMRGPLDPSEIGQIGIMRTDKEEGAFRLEVDWIGVYRESP
jgi:hypothetical protein